MTNNLLRHPRPSTGKWVRKLGGFGTAFGLAAVLAIPAQISAAPLSGSAMSGQSGATLLEILGNGVQLVHCCHTHPYPPYDEYCCHGAGAYVAGAAVSAGIAYGVYRGIGSSVHHYGHYGHGRPGFHPGGGRPGGGFHGRRSDIVLKHDIVLLGHLSNGIGFYRFSYNGSNQAYVGVLAQDVQKVVPEAVTRGSDGYLRVFYDKLGVKFQTYKQWIASGARVPAGSAVSH